MLCTYLVMVNGQTYSNTFSFLCINIIIPILRSISSVFSLISDFSYCIDSCESWSLIQRKNADFLLKNNNSVIINATVIKFINCFPLLKIVYRMSHVTLLIIVLLQIKWVYRYKTVHLNHVTIKFCIYSPDNMRSILFKK